MKLSTTSALHNFLFSCRCATLKVMFTLGSFRFLPTRKELEKLCSFVKNRQKGRLHLLNGAYLTNLTSDPTKFCEAFGIARQENGLDLLNSEITITDSESIPSKLIKRSSRIGIQQGVEKRWRFFITGNPWVSR